MYATVKRKVMAMELHSSWKIPEKIAPALSTKRLFVALPKTTSISRKIMKFLTSLKEFAWTYKTQKSPILT